MNMVNHNMKWTLVFEDFEFAPFQMTEGTNFLRLRNEEDCCIIKNQPGSIIGPNIASQTKGFINFPRVYSKKF